MKWHISNFKADSIFLKDLQSNQTVFFLFLFHVAAVSADFLQQR